MTATGALRPSLFPNVPPLLNYLPGPDGEPIYPPYHLREQLWRVPIAVLQLVSPKSSKKANEDKMEDIFEENVKDAGDFKYFYDGCNLNQMPSMVELSRKDLFWNNFKTFRTQIGPSFGNFVPYTVLLPSELEELQRLMQKDPDSWWILKPPNLNGGAGIKIVNNVQDLPQDNAKKKKRKEKKLSLKCVQTTSMVKMYDTISSTPAHAKDVNCVQRYIRDPYLINNHKFDLRLYVLITSLDPLTVYLYNDGLVRFATEPYSNLSQHIHNKFIHLTNYQINKDSGNFIYNDDPSASLGHKWRLKHLWKTLKNIGIQGHATLYQPAELNRVWARVEDMVIKSILTGLDQIREAGKESSSSRYNSYKLLGLDVILDSGLMPHLLEINTRPALYECPLDKAVNQPMVNEILKIVGYNLPKEMLLNEDVRKMFGVPEDKVNEAGFAKWMYTKILSKDDIAKQNSFKDVEERDDWRDKILENLTAADLRVLVKCEEELRACDQFSRIFPTSKTHSYFPMASSVSYFDKLLDAYEHLCQERSASETLCLDPSISEEYGLKSRAAGINLVAGYCRRGKHLINPFLANNINEDDKETVVFRERNRTKCATKIIHKRNTLDCSDLRFKRNDTAEIKRRLDEMGGFATLSKVKKNSVLEDRTNHHNDKYNVKETKRKSMLFETDSRSVKDLARFDEMTVSQFSDCIKSTTINLKPFAASRARILFVGDSTLSSLNVKEVFAKVDSCPSRSYKAKGFSYLTTMDALERDKVLDAIKEQMEEGGSSGERLVVALYLGVWQGRERDGARGAAHRILELANKINNMGVSTVVLSLLPLLITERRGDRYSKSWTSQVNDALSSLCSQMLQPYLPLHHLLYSQTSSGLGVAPSRSMVATRAQVSSNMANNIAKEVVSYVATAHQLIKEGEEQYY